MPRNETSILVKKILLKKAQIERLEEAKQEAMFAARQLLLAAHEEGFSQTQLAVIFKTNSTRMKEVLAQAKVERSQNV